MEVKKLILSAIDSRVLRKFVSKDKTRQTLKLINLGKDYVEATDGKSLIRIAVEHDLDPAAYKVLSEIKISKWVGNELVLEKSELQYPNTDSVQVKDNEEFQSINIDNSELSISGAVIDLYEYTGNAINYAFLERIAPLELKWDIHKLGEEKQICLKSGKYSVVLLPFSHEVIKTNKNQEAMTA